MWLMTQHQTFADRPAEDRAFIMETGNAIAKLFSAEYDDLWMILLPLSKGRVQYCIAPLPPKEATHGRNV